MRHLARVDRLTEMYLAASTARMRLRVFKVITFTEAGDDSKAANRCDEKRSGCQVKEMRDFLTLRDDTRKATAIPEIAISAT